MAWIGVLIIVSVVVPLDAFFQFSSSSAIDTDYWTLRYMFYLAYIVCSNLHREILQDQMKLLVCEGILLTQIVSMLMYNELNIQCLMACFVPFLLQ